MVDDATAAGAADRELAARRRELEDEFDSKLRELKAQEKRRLDRLKEDQAEWEQTRRAQAKDLADRAEKLRRQETNATRSVETKAAVQQDVEDLRSDLAEVRESRAADKQDIARLQDRVAKEKDIRRAEALLLSLMGGAAIVGALVWLALAWARDDRQLIGWAVFFLAVILGMNLWRVRIRR